MAAIVVFVTDMGAVAVRRPRDAARRIVLEAQPPTVRSLDPEEASLLVTQQRELVARGVEDADERAPTIRCRASAARAKEQAGAIAEHQAPSVAEPSENTSPIVRPRCPVLVLRTVARHPAIYALVRDAAALVGDDGDRCEAAGQLVVVRMRDSHTECHAPGVVAQVHTLQLDRHDVLHDQVGRAAYVQARGERDGIRGRRSAGRRRDEALRFGRPANGRQGDARQYREHEAASDGPARAH